MHKIIPGVSVICRTTMSMGSSLNLSQDPNNEVRGEKQKYGSSLKRKLPHLTSSFSFPLVIFSLDLDLWKYFLGFCQKAGFYSFLG